MNNNLQTPSWLCELMIDELPTGVKRVLEPTPGQGNIVSALRFRGYKVTAPKAYKDAKEDFDAVVMNPPFSPSSICFEIFFDCIQRSNYIVALMPWKLIDGSDKRLAYLKQYGIRGIKILPRSVFYPGGRSCILLTLEWRYKGTASFEILNNPRNPINLDNKLWYKTPKNSKDYKPVTDSRGALI